MFCTLTSWEWVVFLGVVDHFIFSLSKYFGVKPQDTTGTVRVKCLLPRSQESFLSLPHRIGSWCLSSWLFSLLLKLTFISIFFICSLYAFLQELCPGSAKVFYEHSNLKMISSEFPWDPDAQWAHSVMSSVFALALSTQVPMSWTFKHSTLCSGILLLAVSHLLLDHPKVVLQHCWSVIPWLPSLCFRWSFHFFFLKENLVFCMCSSCLSSSIQGSVKPCKPLVGEGSPSPLYNFILNPVVLLAGNSALP